MAHFWFILTVRWSLEDVQAVLNVLISVLSAIGIFTFARFCWQNATLHLTKQQDVPVASLLSLTSPGEAFQVLWFLNLKSLTTKRYRRILVQSLIIFGLSVSAVLSGPIARFASRRGTTVFQVPTDGLLASTTWSNMIEADVIWNQTKTSLEEANFPMDQLLDFLPDSRKPWVYRQDEWNNTWGAKCAFDPDTPISLEATGNYSGDWFVEIPEMWQIVPEDYRTEPGAFEAELGSWGNDTWNEDVLIFVMATIQQKQGSHSSEDISMGLLISAVHLHGVPAAPLNSNGTFGIGRVRSASYTRVICDLERSPSTINKTYIAYPNLWTPDDDTFAQAIESHYHATLVHQGASSQPISVPTAQDMFRFYQAYMISKDTQYSKPVTRLVSTLIPTVELSSVFLAVVILLGFLILTGLIYHSFFLLQHRSSIHQMPESKLDWLLQSLKEAERVNGSPELPGERRRSSATSPKPKTTFESATYRWMNTWHEDGQKPVGGVVIQEEVEMESPSQTFQQSPPPQPLRTFGSSQSFQPYQHVDDSTSLIGNPGRRSWHYCSGHGEDCTDRVSILTS